MASSWEHYHDKFLDENHEIDFSQAKKRHSKSDSSLRKEAIRWLTKAEEKHLSKDEISILNLISTHKHPRRQLFWAYQAKHNYKNLKDFFDENAKHMLPVTTSGSIIKPPSKKK